MGVWAEGLAELLFWAALVGMAYAYLGYPLFLLVLSKFRTRPVRRAHIAPDVTLIIAAHNEERCIREKLDNTLSLEYPCDKLQVIVASDGSDDRTNEIVLDYERHGVELVATSCRTGKEFAQRKAIEYAKGEILVFTDSSIILGKSALTTLVSNFFDSSVGCVSCEDSLTKADDQVSGESLYTRYEMWVRRLESQVGSIVGLSGFCFAARSKLCQKWADDLASDFFLLLTVVKSGYRGTSDPHTLGHYRTAPSMRREFRRKVRTVLRGITVLMANRDILNPFRYGLFAVQVLSHKLLKWLVPAFLFVMLMTNLLLVGQSTVYAVLGLLQGVFYGTAVCGIAVGRFNRMLAVRAASFFLISNYSIAWAWFKYLKGERIILWEPTRRAS